jgi:hypothetical protein
MPNKPTRSRRAVTAARWPAGVAFTTWRYVWRTTPIHRGDEPGTREEDLPRSFPDEFAGDDAQHYEHGVGPLFHRLYGTPIRDAKMSATELMSRLSADPDQVAPGALARFQKVTGEDGSMRPGDEFYIRMPGPWDGPVRVVETTPLSFRFVTLEHHLEAGQVEWRAWDEGGLLFFQIESWARAGDRLSAIMHDRLRMAKEVQLYMWTSVHERVAECAGGRRDAPISICTRRVEPAAFER